MSLLDAADALDDIACGRSPARARLISGALALNTFNRRGPTNRDLLDAAAGLETLSTGGDLGLDASGRERAAKLAIAVRNAIATSA